MDGKEKQGIIWAAAAYLLWGILPIYWKLLGHVPSSEILAHRIFWAFITTMAVVLITGQAGKLKADFLELWKRKKEFWSLFAASVLVSGNWFLFIWAVNNGHIVQTSLGYYINPLLSILLGIIFLKERLLAAEKVAVLLAAAGVLIITISFGQFPWLSFGLAMSFAFYGLLKKTIHLDALRGLTIETAFIAPFAAVYLAVVFAGGDSAFLHSGSKSATLLVLSGAATAVPLVLFAKGAQNIPLYLLGFLQYIAPTLMLFLGVIIYGEPFGLIELIAFSFIWSGLILVTASKFRLMRKMRAASAK
ncbi:EamA family transporter RarD [Bhargavaea ullalensis]|uniref:Chloramphenicol-sensitive protein RarD n=1 Tax=Bhargavaea ullalensis TaxID=1265685 RepID=A0ABV2GAS4_9BACL